MASNMKCIVDNPDIEMTEDKTFEKAYGMLLEQTKGDNNDLRVLIKILIAIIVCSSPDGLYKVEFEFNCPRKFVEVATDASGEIWQSFISYSNGDKRLLDILVNDLISRLAQKSKIYSSMDMMKEKLLSKNLGHIK